MGATLPTPQVLPVSDTSVRGADPHWRDSYPYSSLCVFALHPLYLCLQALAGERCGTVGADYGHGRLGCGRGVQAAFITRPSERSNDAPRADELPADIAAEIEEARKALDLEEGVDYEATMKVGCRSWGGSN